MARYKLHKAGKDGWSDWETPIMDGYKMACCDCGLVHDIDFRAIQVGRARKDGTWLYRDMPNKRYRVKLRVRRNNRATAAIRRKKKQ